MYKTRYIKTAALSLLFACGSKGDSEPVAAGPKKQQKGEEAPKASQAAQQRFSKALAELSRRPALACGQRP